MHSVISTTMRPLIRLLLRHGVSSDDVNEIQRKLFVEVAESEFIIAGRKQSDARIAVITGISRREVKRIRADLANDIEPEIKMNRASWALSAWGRDEEFLDENGQRKALSITDNSPGSFQALIKKYCGDIPFRAILDELLEVGAVVKNDDGKVLPAAAGYVPNADSAELLRVSFQSVADHISSIDYNAQNIRDDSRLQLTLQYDNVPEESVELFRLMSREKSKELLRYLDGYLASQDRDANPELNGTGKVRTGLSVFYFEEKLDDDADE